MGVEGLSKVIKPIREVELSEFKGYTFAIDALLELHRVFKGKVVLTNKNGEKTHHIHSLLATILKLEHYGIKQIWIFDHDASRDADPSHHFKYKSKTLTKRRLIREKNEERLHIAQQNKLELETRMSQLDETQLNDIDSLLSGLESGNTDKEIETMQKRVDSPHYKEISDLKFMLNTLGIEWLEAPATYEGEAIAAQLVQYGIAHCVFTADLDALLYGGTNVLRRSGYGKDTKYFLYNLSMILLSLKISYQDLIKVGLCLGTDANPDGIKGIGPKTVLTKFKTVDWSDTELSELITMFSRQLNFQQLALNNAGSIKFAPAQQLALIDWLVDVQTFDKTRITKQFENSLHNGIAFNDNEGEKPILQLDT